MSRKKQTFIFLIEVVAVVMLVIVLGKLLPPLLGIKLNRANQSATSALLQGQSYPPPVTAIPTVTSTDLPYPPPLTVTPLNTPTQNSTSTPGETVTPVITEGATNTPIPTSTIANDPDGEILFLDVENNSDTNLKKIIVDKSGKTDKQASKIPTDELPNRDGLGGLGNVFLSPDGKKLFIVRKSEGPDYLLVDISNGKSEALFNQFDVFLGWHPDSKHLLFRDFRGLWLVDLKGKKEVNIAPTEEGKGYIDGASVSPDGKKVVFSYSPFSSFGSEIWTVNDDGKNSTKMFDNPGRITNLTWSPDGTKIAYWDGGYRVMDANGTNLRSLNRLSNRNNLPPIWSPDSQMLLVDVHGNAPDSSSEFDGSNIYIINVQSGETRTILPDGSSGNYYPAWSPDGKKIAFVSIRNGKPDIWAINLDGTDLHPVTQDGRYLRFPFWRKPNN